MKNVSIILFLLACMAFSVNATERVKSTRKNLQTAVSVETLIDTVQVADAAVFCDSVIVMRGYSKRAGATKETFMLTNNSNLYITAVEITFRYTDTEGAPLHERTEIVSCDLPPYSSRQLSIKTFDEGKKFYYHKSKPTKGAIAYNVAVKILSYSVKISRETTD